MRRNIKIPQPYSKSEDLHQQAEDNFRGKANDMPDTQEQLMPDTSLSIFQELRVHQIQLEMQNDELQRIRAELEASQIRFFDLYDLAPVGYVTLNEDGLIQQFNLRASTLLGIPHATPIRRSITSIIFHEDKDIFQLAHNRLHERGEMQTCELRITSAGGTPVWVHVTLVKAKDATGTPELRLAFSDITERKQAELALDAEHNLLRTLVDLLPTPVFVKDRESKFLLANAACAQAMEVSSPELLIHKTDADFFPPAIANKFRSEEIDVMQGQRALDREQRSELKNGDLQVLLVSKVPLQNRTGEITGLVGVGFDITQRVQMEDELRANEAFQLDILNSLPAHIAVLDKIGTILAVNEPWLRFGRENGNAGDQHIGVGTHYLDVCRTANGYVDIYAKAAADGVEDVLSGRLPCFTSEYPCDSPQHSRWFKMQVISLAGKSGGAIVAHSDISERKHAQRLLAWEKTALESIIGAKSPDQALDQLMLGLETQIPGTLCSVSILDADGIHLRLDSAPSLPSEFTREIDGIAIGTAAHENQQVIVLDIGSDPSWAGYRELALKHGLHTCWSTPIRSQGKILGVFSIYSREPHPPVAADTEIFERTVNVVRIAIERKQAANKILQLNTDLEQRVEKRTAELQAANKELDSFTYSVSHDLRAPLRAVDGFSHMVIKDYAEKLDDEGKRKLNVIRNEAHRMERLIDDLLAFSRLGRQQINAMPIDMEAIARDVFHELSTHHQERKLQLYLDKIPFANGSDALIRQVWINLISNAIKFTSNREIGEIEIGAKCGDDGAPIYFIKDNGVGFDMRHANKLFGVFQRLHSQEEFSGTGVGLALVQRIIVRHGGSIWADAKINQGATFYFTLPGQTK